MTIAFNSIPLDVRTFGQFVEFDNTRAVQGTPLQPHVALIIAQKLAAGSIAAEIPTAVPSSSLGETYFGAGSHIAEMIRVFKLNNPTTELFAIALDDGGGATAGTQTVTITGPATEDGELVLYIGGRRVVTAVTDGDTATVVGAAMSAAVAAHTDFGRMPFTVADAVGVVTYTARNLGTISNGIDIRVNFNQGEVTPAGLTVVIAAGVTGATDPAMSDAIAAMAAKQYNTIISSLADATSMTAMEAELLTRWGPLIQQEGQFFVGATGTQSALTVIGNARNSQFSTVFEVGGIVTGSPTPVYLAAAAAGAVDAFQTGVDPARPRQTLPLLDVLPPEESDRFTQTEQNILLTDGIATHYTDNGGVVRIQRLITTWQTNALALPDVSYLDITTLRNLAFIRFAVRARVAARFPRHKLADDGTAFGPGQKVVTPTIMKSTILALFKELEALGLVEGFTQFKTEIIVERSSTDVNRIDTLLPFDLINQFRVLAGQIQFLL